MNTLKVLLIVILAGLVVLGMVLRLNPAFIHLPANLFGSAAINVYGAILVEPTIFPITPKSRSLNS